MMLLSTRITTLRKGTQPTRSLFTQRLVNSRTSTQQTTRRRLSTGVPPEQPHGTPNAHRQLSFVVPDQHSAKHLLDRITALDQRLNYQGWHTLRWTALIFVVGSGTFWFFRENVSSGVGDAASEVTRRTLENQDVQLQASALARGVVYELLNDKRALELTSQFLNEVIQREATKVAVLGLVQDILSRPETEVALRNLVSNVLTHQESAQKAVQFLQHVVAIPESREALVTVLSGVFAQPTTQAMTSDFFKGVMQSENFVNSTNKLGADTVQFLLNNEDLKMTAVQWCNAVLNEPALQSTAGDAVWAAVKGAFVPWGKPKAHPPAVTGTSHSASPSSVIQPSPASTGGPQASTLPRTSLIVSHHPIDAAEILVTAPPEAKAVPISPVSALPIILAAEPAPSPLESAPFPASNMIDQFGDSSQSHVSVS